MGINIKHNEIKILLYALPGRHEFEKLQFSQILTGSAYKSLNLDAFQKTCL